MLRFILLFVILLIVNSLDLPNNLNDLNRLLVTKSREFNILDDELLKMEKEREPTSLLASRPMSNNNEHPLVF